jgi:hypothetical protein
LAFLRIEREGGALYREHCKESGTQCAMGRADGALVREGGSETILINGWGEMRGEKERECKGRERQEEK